MVKQCNACGHSHDSNVTGIVRIKNANDTCTKYLVTYCAPCVALMNANLNRPKETAKVPELETEHAWETPNWDSD